MCVEARCRFLGKEIFCPFEGVGQSFFVVAEVGKTCLCLGVELCDSGVGKEFLQIVHRDGVAHGTKFDNVMSGKAESSRTTASAKLWRSIVHKALSNRSMVTLRSILSMSAARLGRLQAVSKALAAIAMMMPYFAFMPCVGCNLDFV